MFRQGDVLIQAVSAIPDDAKPVPGATILAHGEATGHAHEIKSKAAKLLETADGRRWLTVARPVVLRHQEHDPVTLPPGIYEVRRQREYSPEAIRNVAD